MPRLSEARWQQLRQQLVGAGLDTPEWTASDLNDAGLALLELLAFVAEEIGARAALLPGRAEPAVRRLSDAVAGIDRQLTRGSAAADGTDVWSGTRRVHYFDGQLLTARDFADEQHYHLERRRRYLQLLHGAGVVSGLEVSVSPEGTGVLVSPGAAIVSTGNEVHVCGKVVLHPEPGPDLLFVIVHHIEREVDPSLQVSGAALTPTRIEEGGRVATSKAIPADGLAIARVAPSPTGWTVDGRFRVHRFPPLEPPYEEDA